MAKPWDVPASAPLRPGNRNPNDIYLAVGRALTKWEELEAEMGALFAVVTGGSDQWHYVPATEAFGVLNSPKTRVEMIEKAGQALFMHFYSMADAETAVDCAPYEKELENIIGAYTGWTARRNDVAHGCVTTSEHPDYEVYDKSEVSGGEPLITTYSLCPSHGNARKWHIETVEPKYHYKAEEIEKFADAFGDLAKQVSVFSSRLDQWRKEMTGKLRPRSPSAILPD